MTRSFGTRVRDLLGSRPGRAMRALRRGPAAGCRMALPAMVILLAGVAFARHDLAGLEAALIAGLMLLSFAGGTAPGGAAFATARSTGRASGRAAFQEPFIVLTVDHGASTSTTYAEGASGLFGPEIRRASLRDDCLDPEDLPPDWLTTTRAARQYRLEQALHRTLDITASFSLLVLTLPLLLLVALAIKLDSPGPVLYRQERVGRRGRVFTILKFRSMTVDAEAGGPVWCRVQDPRVTRVGQFLRLTRIDEIPQALNILRGDMAFVGPRPERPGFVEQLSAMIPHYADRDFVRPGLTGWAQVRFRYGASVDDARNKLAFDLYYIENRSIWLDMRIVLATVRVVLFQSGAR